MILSIFVVRNKLLFDFFLIIFILEVMGEMLLLGQLVVYDNNFVCCSNIDLLFIFEKVEVGGLVFVIWNFCKNCFQMKVKCGQ